jgi:predicted AlkP superfamily pyrophosphatase or phosphodiesterase
LLPDAPYVARMALPRSIAACCFLLLACAHHDSGRGHIVQHEALSRPKASLPRVISIVVDQLPIRVMPARTKEFSRTGGFYRLAQFGGGELQHPYAITETAPGHATLYTGELPQTHRILGNERIDPASRKKVSILLDPASTMIAGDPSNTNLGQGSSLKALAVPTVADEVRAKYPKATIVSLSLKDRGALFGGGHSPTASVWYNAGTHSFVTSSAVATALPAWVQPNPASMLTDVWKAYEPKTAALAKIADDVPGEGNLAGLGSTFPHTIAGAGVDSAQRGLRFRATPFADDALLELAERAVRSASTSEPFFLALSLSANDYIGHVFGPDSREAADAFYRLDARLGAFLQVLDHEFGEGHYTVYLTSDHGVLSLPEIETTRCLAQPGRCRIEEHALEQTAQKAATVAVGEGDWILGLAEPLLTFTDSAKALPKERFQKLRDAVKQALQQVEGIRRVWLPSELQERCARNSQHVREVLRCNALSGDFGAFIELQDSMIFETGYVPGFGTNHGTYEEQNRRVPFFAKNDLSAPHRLFAHEYANVLRRVLGLALKPSVPVEFANVAPVPD